MRAHHRFHILLLTSLLLGCAADVTRDDRLGQQSWTHPAPRPAKADGLAAGGYLVFGATGGARWLDPHSGASSALERQHDTDPHTVARDVVYDRWRARALVFYSDEDDQGGEIVAFPLVGAPAELGDGEHVVWVDGRVRMLPVPEGLVLFEQSYGERWRLLAASGEPTVSSVAPRPLSAFAVGGSGPSVVHGLVRSEDGAMWLSAAIGARGFGAIERQPLPSSALRMALSPGGTLLIAEPSALIVDDGHTPTRIALPPAGRIEGMAVMSESRAALLLAEPAAVMVVDWHAEAPRLAQAPLSGLVEPADGALSRSLAAVDGARLLAATREGVFALDVDDAGGVLALQLDHGFDGSRLRGPMAASQ